jgi:hypothetical protein
MCCDFAASSDSLVEAGAPALAHRLRLRETGSKGLDNAADAIRDLNKRFQNRLTLDNPRFVDHYLEGELLILVRFRIGKIDKDFIACFQREKNIGGCNKNFREHLRYTGRQANPDESRSDRNNQAVFVDIVKAMEDPEISPPTSLVWFERANRIDSVLPHALYFSWKSGFEFFGRRGDQKTCLVPVSIGTSSANQVQLLSQVVQRTSQVIEDIPSDSREASWNGFGACDVIDQLSRIRIALGCDFVGLGVEKGADCRIEVIDMFVGPFNF